MNLSNNDYYSEINQNENIILSIKNNSENNELFLKKIDKNKRNKNTFNISNIKQKSKYSLKAKSNYSKLDNNDNNSFYNNKKQKFGNEILAKAMERNKTKINLKEFFKDKNSILFGNKRTKHNNNYNLFNTKYKKGKSNKKRINSARPLILDYKKRFNDIEELINLKEFNNYYDSLQKIVAYKENILVYEKNISLSDNNHNNNDIINQNNIINNNANNTDFNTPLIKETKSKINQKFKRPKSAVYGYSKDKNNLIFQLNDISLKNQSNNIKDNNIFIQTKPIKIFDDKFYDLSYVINDSKKEINIKKKNNTKIKEKIMVTPQSFFSESPSEKKYSNNEEDYLFHEDYNNNIDDFKNMILNSNMKLSNKVNINRGHIFRRRPIPFYNEKYLIYLPKDIKKDVKNKYNFFSYLLTENIYYNSEKNNYLSIKNSKKNKKTNFEKKKKTDKIKHNLTEYNFNQNKNLFQNFKLNCKKEEEFMSYLKNLDYIQKHPKKINNKNKNINNNNIISFKSKINKMINIYKPVKLKVDNYTSYELFPRNKDKIDDKKIGSSEEEIELYDKIKSQPFHNKKKFKFNK